MTFDEYNTDEVFKGNSTADELVKLAKDEGKKREDVEKSLSPLWKEDKKGNVKKALDKYYTVETPKKEEVKEEVKETEKPAEPFKEEEAPKPKTTLTSGDKNYMQQVDDVGEATEEKELEKITKNSDKNYNALYDTMDKQGKAFGKIDDKLVAQLPTFMIKRYTDGEFGDPKSSDAKLRLAHFMINGLQSKLKTASNLAAINAGRSPAFADTTSDYEKYQQTNLGQGLENRWNKYKQETQSAIDLAKKEGMNEQDARLAVETLTRNNTMNTKWNMMNEKQKLYAMEITKEMGDYIGNMNMDEIANFIAGSALNEGQNNITKDEVIAIGIAKLAAKSPEIVSNLPAGNVKDIVMSMIGGNGVDVGAGVAGGLLNGTKHTTATTSDGTKIDPGLTMDKGEKAQVENKADSLIADYKAGKITREQLEKDYNELYNLMQSHKIAKVGSSVTSLDKRLSSELDKEAVEKFGKKNSKSGVKIVNYFKSNPKLFTYLSENPDAPMPIENKASYGIKDLKDYQQKQKDFKTLQKADATDLVTKY